MGQTKNISGSVRKLSRRGKEMFFANLNLSPQPVVCLTRLNIPESFKNGKTNNFSINVNSESFKQLLLNINTHKVRPKKITCKALKPKRKVINNKNQSIVGSHSDSFLSNDAGNDNLFVPVAENDSELFIDKINTHKVRPKKITSKALKPKRKVINNKNQSIVESHSDSFLSNDAGNDNLFVPVTENDSELFIDKINTHKVRPKKITSKALKPKRKVINNKNQSIVESHSDSFLSNDADNDNLFVPVAENDSELFIDKTCIPNNESECITQSGDKENLWSQDIGREVIDEDTNYEDNPTESITRRDKVIDTFLHVIRKTTDDNSILSALQRDYICDRCQQGFLKKNTLRKHMTICLGKKKSKRRKKQGSHPCPVCGITYLNKYSLDKHNANVHNLKKMYKCLVCSQHFYNEETLTLHCRSHHGLGGSDIYKCPYCEATFNLRGDLNYHCRRAHNTTQYYICPMCLECFKSEDTCKLHEQSHGYCCDICMFKTKTESEMVAHRVTHLYMVVHKCDKCLRTFKAKRDFTKHIKVHEREKQL